MTNIIRSDIYRLKKSATARNTIIGLLATILLIALMTISMTSGGFTVFLDESTVSVMTEREQAEFQKDLADMQGYFPANAAEFVTEIVSPNILPFFLLPFIIAVFCADFSAGTYRNSLSHESSRARVYIAKLGLDALCCLLLNVITILFSCLLGGLLHGLGGFSAEFFQHILITTLLLLPSQLGAICFGHMLVSFTKKSSSTIAIYLVGLTLLSVALQSLSIIPRLRWLMLLDWSSAGKLLAAYWTLSAGNIAIIVCSGLAVAALTTALGLAYYQKTDITV